MKITWKNSKKMDSQAILNSIDNAKNVSSTGEVSFSSMGLESELAVLLTAINFPRDIDDLHRYRILWLSVAEVSKIGLLSSDKLLDMMNRKLAKDATTKQHEFHILTSISVGSKFSSGLRKNKHGKIMLLDGEYPEFYQDRDLAINEARFGAKIYSNNYKKVVITIRARSANHATTKGLRYFDIQRAIWSMLANNRMQIIGNEWEPINRIRLGQMHTIHTDDGKAEIDRLWYEPNFIKADLYVPDDIQVFEKNEKHLRKQLSTSKYSEKLEEGLLRYVRALDEQDPNVAFLKIWGALEGLVCPGEMTAESISRRCSFLFKDHSYHKSMIEHLRDYRNGSVHAGDQNSRAKMYVYLLQYYFRTLIFFHLGQNYIFSSLADANSFLDLSPDRTALLRQKELLEKGLLFVK